MSTLKVDTIQDKNDVEMYLCKAWVNFNGTGTVAIRASGNVSSITDGGTGIYTINFTNSFADADYCLVATGNRNSGEMPVVYGRNAQATGSATVKCGYAWSVVYIDPEYVNVAVFR